MKLLRIDASARIEASESRLVADKFQAQWEKVNPNGQVTIRDIVTQPIPHINQDTITGFYTTPEELTQGLKQATALSDELIKELKETDILLISSPMYNFGVPSALKAWIDQIVRINQTFGVAEDSSFYGMVENVKAYVVTAAGAVYTSEQMKVLDFLKPYLQTVLGLVGITDVTFLPLEGTNLDIETFESMKKEAEVMITNL